MARTIVQPQCSVSPAGGGTISYQATTSGSFSWHSASAYQNYKYTATPARGYRFVRFETTVVENWAYHFPDNPSSDSSGSSTYTPTFTTNPYESDMVSGGSEAGAFWFAEDYGWEQYEFWNSAITVVAVFERIPDGPYLLYDDTTGQLLYAPSSGQLIYGGNIT